MSISFVRTNNANQFPGVYLNEGAFFNAGNNNQNESQNPATLSN
jgi:hypothetical protein